MREEEVNGSGEGKETSPSSSSSPSPTPFPSSSSSSIFDDGSLGPASADQITVNDYPPGSGIAPHVDTHSAFTARFASLSLGAGAAFELRRGGEAAELWLPRRSLLLLGGEARLGWAHYIAPRRGDSVSREAAALDEEVARAVALAEEKEKEKEEVEGRKEGREEEKANGGKGGNVVASAPAPSTTVVIPRRRRVSITIRQVRRWGVGDGGSAPIPHLEGRVGGRERKKAESRVFFASLTLFFQDFSSLPFSRDPLLWIHSRREGSLLFAGRITKGRNGGRTHGTEGSFARSLAFFFQT